MTSISVVVSGRNVGTVTSCTSGASPGATTKAMGASKRSISSLPSSVPRMAFTREVRTRTGERSGRFPRASRAWPAIDAPVGASNSAKRAAASSRISGSVPRSNRAEASLRRLSRLEVRAMVIGSHHASSSRTAFVVSEISVDAPPMTPAMATATSSPSVSTPSAAVSVRSTSSRVTMRSPSRAKRTRRAVPDSLARS